MRGDEMPLEDRTVSGPQHTAAGRLREVPDLVVINRQKPQIHLHGRILKVPTHLVGSYAPVIAETDYMLFNPVTVVESDWDLTAADNERTETPSTPVASQKARGSGTQSPAGQQNALPTRQSTIREHEIPGPLVLGVAARGEPAR
jgi:hypothetical protein